MNIQLDETTFYVSDKERVSFCNLVLNGNIIGKVMLSTKKELCSIADHEATVRALSKPA